MSTSTLSATAVLDAGRLRLAFEQTRHGIRLTALDNRERGVSFLASPPLPLFALTLRNAATGETVALCAADGWETVSLSRDNLAAGPLALAWNRHEDARFPNLAVAAEAAPRPEADSVEWSLRVTLESDVWAVWRVIFPQLAIAKFDPSPRLFIPRGPGETPSTPWDRPFEFRLPYPRDYCGMQYMAVYESEGESEGDGEGDSASVNGIADNAPPPAGGGLYVAHHDPTATTKEISAVSDPAAARVTLAFDHPPVNMGVPGAGFILPGRIVWRLFRGDWFDATALYKDWVYREAAWMPTLEHGVRADTPAWLRDGCVWMRMRGDATTVVPVIKKFAAAIGFPVAFHWYNWHQIPYDNDYPHYFPATEGFVDGVRELQAAGIRVTPYINGRIWDTRDHGTEDWQFTSVAKPHACKDEKGELYLETYLGRETDGSLVQLAVMCPATDLWQSIVADLVRRLFHECGVDGVYIDQVAAACPTLCFDPTHGHPLGGGSWWNEAYQALVRRAAVHKPEGRIFTTESNAEPHVATFDGYLSWHWQFENHVPAFPQVYAGAVQIYGRSFRPGPTKALSYRMKSGQQLVFGEQIGWVEDPNIVDEPETLAFLRHLGGLRWNLREFFSAGTLVRPPRFVEPLPKVRGDLRFPDEWWVTMEAVLAGAWRHPETGRVAFLFVNVSDQPVRARVRLDPSDYGLADLSAPAIQLTDAEKSAPRTDGNPWMPSEPRPLSDCLSGPIDFPPATAFAFVTRVWAGAESTAATLFPLLR